LAVQYADFAAWQRRWLDGELLDRRLEAVRAALAGAPLAIELPLDRPRPMAISYRGDDYKFQLAAETEARVRALAQASGASPFMVLLAGFATLVGRLAETEDLLIGSPVAGRSHREVEGLIGFFINMLVLRVEPRAAVTFGDLVGQVRARVLEAYAGQDLPFERLVEELNPERDPSRTPLFQTLFNFQTAEVGNLELPGVELRPIRGGTRAAKTDLSLQMTDRGTGLGGALEYLTDLFDAATVERWARHFETLLAAAVEDPERALSALPLLSAAGPAALPAPAFLLHRRFEERAAERPEAPAVTLDGESLSFAEVDRRANRLARRLRALGVGPEARVGLCLNRSFDLVVAILAVLKAGGAYVPLDPAYPAERNAFALEESAALVVVTRSDV